MSYLKITTRTNQTVCKEFIDMFIAIADGTSDEAPIAMMHLDALPMLTNEAQEENRDIQYMAIFMLLTGSQLAYRDQAYGFHFGDVDLMDNYDDWKGWTVMQHEVEDLSEPEFKDVYAALKKVDADCMRDGADSIPFTDTEYYTEQIQNIFNFTDTAAELMADKLRKFDIFKASGKDITNIYDYSEAYGEEETPRAGRVYLSVEEPHKCGLIISSIDHEEGKWWLLIENWELVSDDLLKLELELFEWAMSAGWCDDL